ncbi:hypothetical protein DPMN_158196 [Dreissena polymorpha]|uniref:Conodipine-M alpha chain n=1 Tax=Dreissena polymorpha TaxID=45954 RepID=A0A9D4IPJ8_DREPO|nr:hypothetical protein DPMN_158196 [Dreissena polymorpha]
MKLGIVIALTTAVMLMGLNIYADACRWDVAVNYWADGCSGVSDLWFTNDCHKHDICYACGARFGISRLECDNRWNENMKRSCKRSGGLFCSLIRATYYRTVRNHMEGSYRYTPAVFCDQDWVWDCAY